MTAILCLVILGTLVITGCGKKDNINVKSGDNSIAEGYYFKDKETMIIMNSEADKILSELGEYNKFTKVPSCAYQGNDKIYSYNGYNIYTNEFEKKDVITSVILTSDLVSTPEGLKIGDSELKADDIYGDNYKEEAGVRTYKKADTELKIIIEKDAVTSIEYYAIR